MWSRDQVAAKAAEEIADGLYVKLGIGIPPLVVANYISDKIIVILQSENGMFDMGPFPIEGQEDADRTNAGKQTITEQPHSCYLDSAQSFCMIRGGKSLMAILGEMEVTENGDIDNWMIPDKLVKGIAV